MASKMAAFSKIKYCIKQIGLHKYDFKSIWYKYGFVDSCSPWIIAAFGEQLIKMAANMAAFSQKKLHIQKIQIKPMLCAKNLVKIWKKKF